MAEPLKTDLPPIHRHITTHREDGKAVLSTISADPTWQPIGDACNFFLAYTTRSFPVELNEDKAGEEPADIKSYQKDLADPPGLSVNGTVCRFVDFAPDKESYMHRTESIDYGVVLEGSVEMHLDSGEFRTMHRGDVCVQRATNHAWKNVTPNHGWARMMFVLVASEKIRVGGKELGEELGTIPEAVKRNA